MCSNYFWYTLKFAEGFKDLTNDPRKHHNEDGNRHSHKGSADPCMDRQISISHRCKSMSCVKAYTQTKKERFQKGGGGETIDYKEGYDPKEVCGV